MKTNIIILLVILTGCSTIKMLPEDELFITRKYAGDVISCEQIGTPRFGDAPMLRVFTNGSELSDIVIYAKEADFKATGRVYIILNKRGTMTGDNLVYELESGSGKFRICEFAFGSKLLTQTWY